MGCRGLHCGGCRTGGGGLGVLAVLAGVVAVAALGYRAADSALTGLAASTAAANQVIAWALGAVAVVAAVVGGGWVLLARRRTLRDAPTVEAFRTRVDAALTARDTARAQLGPIGPGRAPAVERARVQVSAVRLDRLGPGGVR